MFPDGQLEGKKPWINSGFFNKRQTATGGEIVAQAPEDDKH
jgi:hypothetical protein